MTGKSKLDWALALADLGFHVFPIEAGVKSPPHIDDFPGKASRDPVQIQRWWTDPVMGWDQDYNVGISTSRFGSDEALLVVDVDNKGDKHGDETLSRLQAEGRVFPDTLEVGTPTGGRHLIYRTPVAVRQSTGQIGDGIDIRSFGGYCVGAGSELPTGSYHIREDREVVPAPDWLVAACGLRDRGGVRPVPGSPGKRHQTLIDPARAAKRAIEYLTGLPEVTEGERNHACFKTANYLKDLGVPEDDCLPLLRDFWDCTPMLDDAEMAVVIASAYRSTRTLPGSASPEVQFSKVYTNGGHRKSGIAKLLDLCRIW